LKMLPYDLNVYIIKATLIVPFEGL
jgi:hypothetical protein